VVIWLARSKCALRRTNGDWSNLAGTGTTLYHRRMLAKLTLRLVAWPEQTWPRFAVAQDQPGTLPSPLGHATSAAFVSVLATGIGWAIRSGSTSGGAILHMLTATVGYVGGATLAVVASQRLLGGSGAPPKTVARFASGAVLPVVLSGVVNVVPFPPLSFVLALAGAASSAHSGWIGASAMLALEGQARKRAAVVPAGLAVSLVLLATFVRMGLPK
jgi:hypothetical protein